MRPDGPRPPLAGPATPQPPFPIAVSGPIVKGFGRGSAELGIPTANIPLAGLSVGGHDELESGVYYGWAGVAIDAEGVKMAPGDERGTVQASRDPDTVGESRSKRTSVPGGTIFPMVMSLGYNPYYKNTVRSIEVHIMHKFQHDFYGAKMNLLICGFIRPEYDYVSKESLVEDINVDIEIAGRSLEREGYRGLLKKEALFRRVTDFSPAEEKEALKMNEEANGKL